MRFRSIYYFDVISKIEAGKNVYILDRCEMNILCANDMTVCDLVAVLKDANGDKNNRYDFWVKEKSEAKEE